MKFKAGSHFAQLMILTGDRLLSLLCKRHEKSKEAERSCFLLCWSLGRAFIALAMSVFFVGCGKNDIEPIRSSLSFKGDVFNSPRGSRAPSDDYLISLEREGETSARPVPSESQPSRLSNLIEGVKIGLSQAESSQVLITFKISHEKILFSIATSDEKKTYEVKSEDQKYRLQILCFSEDCQSARMKLLESSTQESVDLSFIRSTEYLKSSSEIPSSSSLEERRLLQDMIEYRLPVYRHRLIFSDGTEIDTLVIERPAVDTTDESFDDSQEDVSQNQRSESKDESEKNETEVAPTEEKDSQVSMELTSVFSGSSTPPEVKTESENRRVKVQKEPEKIRVEQKETIKKVPEKSTSEKKIPFVSKNPGIAENTEAQQPKQVLQKLQRSFVVPRSKPAEPKKEVNQKKNKNRKNQVLPKAPKVEETDNKKNKPQLYLTPRLEEAYDLKLPAKLLFPRKTVQHPLVLPINFEIKPIAQQKPYEPAYRMGVFAQAFVDQKIKIYQNACNIFVRAIMTLAGYTEGEVYNANEFENVFKSNPQGLRKWNKKTFLWGSSKGFSELQGSIQSLPGRYAVVAQVKRKGRHGHVGIVVRQDSQLFIYDASLNSHGPRRTKVSVSNLLGRKRNNMTVYSLPGLMKESSL